MRDVAVTGGAGFIGEAVVDELVDRNILPWPLDSRDGCDIRDPKQTVAMLEGMDAVIHLAGVLGTHELFDTPHLAYETNVLGALNVLEACRVHGLAYVGITMPQVFPSIYTATKVAQTRLASAYHHTYDIPVSHVRAFNAFGPGQHHGGNAPQKIIPTFATESWAGRPMPIWGDGQQGVDLIYVDDVARVLVDALEFGGDVTIDAGSGQGFTVNQVAEMVGKVTGCYDVEYLPMRRGEVPTDIVAAGDGWDLLDWQPGFDFEDLAETVESYR